MIAVAGGVDPDRIWRALEGSLAGLPKKTALRAPEPGPFAARASDTLRAGKDQATVLVGTRGVPITHPDRTALSAATHILDAQSGRLFLRLREERGLAYGLWSRSECGIGGGTFSAGLSTDPARVEEAMSALTAELELLASEGPTEGELARVVRMMAGLGAMGHQQVIRRAYDLAWCTFFRQPYGIPSLKQRLAALTVASVREALAKLSLEDVCRVIVLPGADEQ